MMPINRAIIASGIMVLTMASVGYISHSEEVHPNKPFSTFPKQIGEWHGVEKFFDSKIYEVLGVDDSYLGYYSTPDHRQVQMYIGFYQSQKEGDLIHSPKNCMPGGGWKILRSEIETVDVDAPDRKRIDVIKLILRKGDERQAVLYWFHSRGRIIASEYLQKIYLVVDSITRRRTDGSFVRLITGVQDGNLEKAMDNLKDFAADLYPVLQEYIPS